MAEEQDPLVLDEKRRTQLDINIKNMLAGGASNDDVVKYASDFKSQFGVKKKAQSAGASTSTQSVQTGSRSTGSFDPARPFGSQQQSERDFIGDEAADRIERTSLIKRPTLGLQTKSSTPQIGYRGDGLGAAFDENIGGAYQSPLQVDESNRVSRAMTAYEAVNGKPVVNNAVNSKMVRGLGDDEEADGTRAGYFYNKILEGFGQVGAGLGDFAVQTLTKGFMDASGMPYQKETNEALQQYSDEAVKSYRENTAPTIRKYLKENIGANVDKRKESNFNNETFTGALGGLFSSAPAIGLTIASGGVGTAAMGAQMFDNSIESINSTEEGRNLPESTKTLFAGGVSLVSTMLEKYSLNRILKAQSGIVSDFVTRQALRNASRATGGKVTGDVFTKFLNKEVLDLTNKYVVGGARALDAAVVEYATEFAQEGTSILGELAVNKSTGKSVFDTKALDSWDGFMENIKRANKSGVAGLIAGGFLGGVSSLANINRSKVEQTQTLLTQIDQNLANENLSDSARQLLIENKFKLEGELEDYARKIDEKYDSLEEKQQDRVNEIVEEKAKLSEAVSDPEISPEVKSTLESQDELLDKELAEIKPTEKPIAVVEENTPVVEDTPAKRSKDTKIDVVRTKDGYEGELLAGKEIIGEGSESTVYRNGDKVIKVGEPYNDASTFDVRIKEAKLINDLVGDGSLEVIGHYESPNGTKNPIYEQNFVEGKPLSEQEVGEHLLSKGFEKTKNGYSIENGGKTYEISDLSDNFFRNSKGGVVGIDASITEIQKQPKTKIDNQVNNFKKNNNYFMDVDDSASNEESWQSYFSFDKGGTVEINPDTMWKAYTSRDYGLSKLYRELNAPETPRQQNEMNVTKKPKIKVVNGKVTVIEKGELYYGNKPTTQASAEQPSVPAKKNMETEKLPAQEKAAEVIPAIESSSTEKATSQSTEIKTEVPNKEASKTPEKPVDKKQQIEALKKELDDLKKLLDASNDSSPSSNRKIISEKQARKLLEYLTKKYEVEGVIEEMTKNFRGQYREWENRILINPIDGISKDTIFHEYLHPFSRILEFSNEELFNEIYAKAEAENKANPFAYIDHYEERKKKDELVVRYLTKMSANDSVPSLLKRFMDWLSDFLFSKRKNADYKTLAKLSKDTTVEELYDIFRNYGSLSRESINFASESMRDKKWSEGQLESAKENLKRLQDDLADRIAKKKYIPKNLKSTIEYEIRRVEILSKKIVDFNMDSREAILARIAQIEEQLKDLSKDGSQQTEEDTSSEESQLFTLAHQNIESNQIRETFSNRERETGKELTQEEKDYNVQTMMDSLRHGVEIVNKAKEEFGNEYPVSLLNFVKDNAKTLSIDKQSLILLSLENDLEQRLAATPDDNTLKKQQKLVTDYLIKMQRSAARATAMGILRQLVRVGYDINQVTDTFFTPKQKEAKSKIEKAVQSTSTDVQSQYEQEEQIRAAIEAGIEKSVNEIYEAMPSKLRQRADKAIAALDRIQKRLRSVTYDASIGVPVAIIDAGITTIKAAIKAGVNVTEAIELGIKKIKEQYGKEWKKEENFRRDMLAGFRREGVDMSPAKPLSTSDDVKTALIDAGYGKQITVTTKEGKEKRSILDWKKLTGEEGSLDRINEVIDKVLPSKDYTPAEIEAVKQGLKDEYNAIHASIIEKAENELENRNAERTPAEIKSSARRLAELYNYGLFEKESDTYDKLINSAVGLSDIGNEAFLEAKNIAKSLAKLYAQRDANGQLLPEITFKKAISELNNKIEALLTKVASKEATWKYKAVDAIGEFMGLSQRNALVSATQMVENTLSGYFERAFIDIGYRLSNNVDTKALRDKRGKLAKAQVADIIYNAGDDFGDVTSPFLTKSKVMDKILSLSDSQVYHAATATLLGRSFLEGADSMHKIALTEKYFVYNLIKILRKKGMPKQEAVEFVSEKLTGQSFENAITQAKELVRMVNEDAGKELISTKRDAVLLLANDIVKNALLVGNQLTVKELEASKKAAYRSAGFGLGHEANNMLSEQITAANVKIQTDLKKAIKDKNWGEAVNIRLKSILMNNIMNPFVGGGTNWMFLTAEKAGINPYGWYRVFRRIKDIDLSSESGMRELSNDLFASMKRRNSAIRTLVGASIGLAVYAASAVGDDEIEDLATWLKKNYWAQRYFDKVAPTAALYVIAKENDDLMKFFRGSLNVKDRDYYSDGKKIYDAVYNRVKGDVQASNAAIGDLIGSKVGTPIIPWRVFRDSQNLMNGLNGLPPVSGGGKPTSFVNGLLKGGMLEYLGLRPNGGSSPSSTEDFKKSYKDSLKKKD